MEKYKEFIGIVEHIHTQDAPSRDYCSLNNQTGGMIGTWSIEGLGKIRAIQLGNKFRDKITYEPPQGIDEGGIERGLCPNRYHRLSVLEQNRFEKSVLDELERRK